MRHLEKVGPGVAQTIEALRNEVQALNPTNANTTTEEHETIQYIFDLLDNAVKTGKENEAFGKKHVLGLLNPLSDKTRVAFGKKLDVNFLRASKIDLKKINITGPSSLEATNAIVNLLSAMLSLIPHEKVSQKRAELENKITAFKQEHAHAIHTTSFETLFELEQLIKTELKYIDLETTCSTRLKQYQALQNLIEEKKEANYDPNEILQLITTVSDKMTQEKNKIIPKFDALTHTFTQKIDELETRSKTVSSNHAKKTYTPAITHARTLIKNLNAAKAEFKQTGDLIAFQKTTQTLLKDFPGRAAFATNRSHPWFRMFISRPFEILKAMLNVLIGLGYKKYSEHPFFKPAQTDTTQQFEAYEKDLACLDKEEKMSI